MHGGARRGKQISQESSQHYLQLLQDGSPNEDVLAEGNGEGSRTSQMPGPGREAVYHSRLLYLLPRLG